MKSHFPLFIGVALLVVTLGAYLRQLDIKAKLIADDDWYDSIGRNRLHMESYFVHQPVSAEIASRASKLGIEITPFFDSKKIGHSGFSVCAK